MMIKRKIFCCFLALLPALSICGCGKADPSSAESSGISGAEQPETSAESGSSGEDLFLALEDLPWRDNSLDAYSAMLNVPLRYTEAEGAISGGISMYMLGNAGASVFTKHLLQTAQDSWDEVKTVTDQGVETSHRLSFREGQVNQAWAVGSIVGTDRFIMMTIEAEDGQDLSYRFFETDQDMQVVNEFYVDCLDKKEYEAPLQLQADIHGNLHMITSSSSDSGAAFHYYIVAPDGNLLRKVSPEGGLPLMPVLFPMYDGRVGVRFEEELKWTDPETGETEVLARVKPDWKGCTLLDEKTLLYADGTGLYRSGLSGEKPEILYTWSSHGVLISKIVSMQAAQGGDISLIYEDGSGANYLKLTPTTEQVEILEITLGISQWNKNFQAAAAVFNRKYPAYHIRTKAYAPYDSRLLTQLMAGEGPVLIDTGLVDFEGSEELWEPLDYFGQALPGEELIPKAMDAGRINGTLYGVVTDFVLNTMVTFAKEPAEWDYDAFLDCFDESAPSIKSVYAPINGGDGFSFVGTFFHGLQEKYLFNAEDDSTGFDSDRFRKIARLGRYFMERTHQGSSEGLRQDGTLCAEVRIDSPEDLAALRIWGGGELRYIGYPSENGSRHYIEGGSAAAICVNATAEEKQLARSFLRYLLSYDAQMATVTDAALNGYESRMSVRRDVLEEQINRMNEYTYTLLPGFPQFHLEDQVDIEQDRAVLYELLEKAEPERPAPGELSGILIEEMASYFDGKLTEDMLVDHLENRVGLYLSEQK